MLCRNWSTGRMYHRTKVSNSTFEYVSILRVEIYNEMLTGHTQWKWETLSKTPFYIVDIWGVFTDPTLLCLPWFPPSNQPIHLSRPIISAVRLFVHLMYFFIGLLFSCHQLINIPMYTDLICMKIIILLTRNWQESTAAYKYVHQWQMIKRPPDKQNGHYSWCA